MKTECPFVVGSGYLTRDGRPALCIGMNPSGDPRNKVVFAVGVPGDTYVYATKIDGTFLRDSMESVDDILPPAPKVVERWVAVIKEPTGMVCSPLLFETKSSAEAFFRNTHAIVKIEVPE